ncbi:5'/3'-nucleotidase SurE [Rikenella microfusus]|uniref:5'/3'-nucleotidase SurE n=1 Tax=Rikenella microfusus TaxID=28139 RepID=UPI003A8ED182
MATSGKPLIFVTNDDGVQAAGIAALIKLAAEFGDVVAVAPNESYSGMSHSITMHRPLFVSAVSRQPGQEIYSCTGTPVDCVKIGFDEILGSRLPDLVLSGINHGSNANISVIYSGTMGAATEAALYGIPSIGFSLTDHSPTADFTASVHYARRIIAQVLELPAERLAGLCLNVNIPDLPQDEIRGIRICRQTRGNWREDFVHRTDPNNRDYYWMSGRFYNFEHDAEESDEWALRHGYVAVVPVQMDLTDYERLDLLRGHMER